MNILCVYVDGGKGHYIPAKAVQEQLEALGHNAVMVDFFEFLGLRLAGRINKFVWRRLLEHPGYEMRFSKRNDQNTDEWQDRRPGDILCDRCILRTHVRHL